MNENYNASVSFLVSMSIDKPSSNTICTENLCIVHVENGEAHLEHVLYGDAYLQQLQILAITTLVATCV